MASSTKTTNLELNKWIGADKPKRDDFNADNQKIDTAVGMLSTQVAQQGQSISAHTANHTAHVTAAERAAWNAKDKRVTGSYQGDGAYSRRIELGFRPGFGMLYADGVAVVQGDPDSGSVNVYSGFFGTAGSSDGITPDATGFTVTHSPLPKPSGTTNKFNEASRKYIYTVFPA